MEKMHWITNFQNVHGFLKNDYYLICVKHVPCLVHSLQRLQSTAYCTLLKFIVACHRVSTWQYISKIVFLLLLFCLLLFRSFIGLTQLTVSEEKFKWENLKECSKYCKNDFLIGYHIDGHQFRVQTGWNCVPIPNVYCVCMCLFIICELLILLLLLLLRLFA